MTLDEDSTVSVPDTGPTGQLAKAPEKPRKKRTAAGYALSFFIKVAEAVARRGTREAVRYGIEAIIRYGIIQHLFRVHAVDTHG